MSSPVDNFSRGNLEAEGDMLPQVEALARLYELCERYDGVFVDVGVATAAARHRAAHGHSLRFGCCAAADPSAIVV